MDYSGTEENIKLIFEPYIHDGEYIAEANDRFTKFASKDIYDREWAGKFHGGRYVITVYQRHSVYVNGERVFLNMNFEPEVGKFSRYRKPCYVLLTDRELEYEVPSWKNRKLTSHFVREDKSPLQVRIFQDLTKAEKTAARLSADGSVAVLEWYEDHDML